MSYNEKKFLDYNGLVHLLGKFDDYPTNDILGTVINSIDTAINAKQDILTFDNIPTENSNNPVKSSGIYEAEKEIKNNKADIIISSVNGAVASFNDGANNAPLKNCILQIQPVQSGSGDPSPINVRPIVGWTGCNIQHTGKNLFDGKFPNINTDILYRAIYVGDSVVTVSTNCIQVNGDTTLLYVLPGNVQTGASIGSNGIWNGQTRTITPINGYITIGYRMAYQVYPSSYDTQIEYGSEATPFEEYVGNSCTITFPALGKNLCPPLVKGIGVSTLTGIEYTGNNVACSDYIPVNFTQNNSYYISGLLGSYNNFIAAYNEEKQFLGRTGGEDSTQRGITKTSFDSGTPQGTGEIAFVRVEQYNITTMSDIDNATIQMEVGSTASAYEPYTNTVYGGTLDLTTGVLTIDYAKQVISEISGSWYESYNQASYAITGPSAFYESKTISYYCDKLKPVSNYNRNSTTKGNYASLISSGARIALSTTATTLEDFNAWIINNPVTFVYELATPITYQLDPITIRTLLGENHIWADAGNIAVQYHADTKAYIDTNEGVKDVQINNASIVNNGIASIPYASTSTYGAVKISGGLYVGSSGILQTNKATSAQIKAGANVNNPIVASSQHESVFYALSKLAGIDLANETVTLGTYPDASKAAIQNLLGITSLFASSESSTATAAHTANSLFMMDGKLHRVTSAITIGDAVAVGTNCEVVKADEVFIKNTDYATKDQNGYGIVRCGNGLAISNGTIYLDNASENQIKGGSASNIAIIPLRQHLSVFYGLAKAAGDTTQASSENAVGTYTSSAAAAIRSMIGAENGDDLIKVQDTQPSTSATKLWMLETAPAGVQVPTVAELEEGYVKKTDIATSSTAGIVKVISGNGIRLSDSNALVIANAGSATIKSGVSAYYPVCPIRQHETVFYGLSKVAGVDLASETVTLGTYPATASAAIRSMLGAVGDVQVNGTSIVSSDVANIPIASASTFGVVKCGTGLSMMTGEHAGKINTNPASTSACKNGAEYYAPITPNHQHEATFYGLAKAAGDTTMASSSNAVGTYTTAAQNAIQTMLGIEKGIELIETVSGTTPSITGQPNTTYQCGEVLTLSITPPANGTIDVYFTSGSTATTLTVPNTVLFPAWFDSTALEADTIYEIMITNGIYGSVMTWQS